METRLIEIDLAAIIKARTEKMRRPSFLCQKGRSLGFPLHVFLWQPPKKYLTQLGLGTGVSFRPTKTIRSENAVNRFKCSQWIRNCWFGESPQAPSVSATAFLFPFSVSSSLFFLFLESFL